MNNVPKYPYQELNLQYPQMMQVSADTLEILTDYMLEEGYIEESENQSILCCWTHHARDNNNNPRSAEIALIRIGATLDNDDGMPVVLFFRRNEKSRERFHIPLPHEQEKINEWGTNWTSDQTHMNYAHMTDYLSTVSNNPNVWTDLKPMVLKTYRVRKETHFWEEFIVRVKDEDEISDLVKDGPAQPMGGDDYSDHGSVDYFEVNPDGSPLHN